MILHLLTLLLTLQTVRSFPIQDDEDELRLTKRSFYPFRDALSPSGFMDSPRVTQGQMKKAVDSTFIRFGRSSSSESGNGRTMDSQPSSSMLLEDSPEVLHQDDTSEELSVSLPQRFLLNHNGCKVTSIQELQKALLTDPNCIRMFQKTKKEKVNDTFIRFG